MEAIVQAGTVLNVSVNRHPPTEISEQPAEDGEDGVKNAADASSNTKVEETCTLNSGPLMAATILESSRSTHATGVLAMEDGLLVTLTATSIVPKLSSVMEETPGNFGPPAELVAAATEHD